MVPLPPAPSPALPTRIKEAASEFCLKVDTENKWVSKGAVALWQHGQVSQDGQAYKKSLCLVGRKWTGSWKGPRQAQPQGPEMAGACYKLRHDSGKSGLRADTAGCQLY